MGRHYSGDIEGKFWFAIQSSNAANRFGVQGQPPPQLDYYFDEENISDIKSELRFIEKSFGIWKDPLVAYFDLYKNLDEAPITFIEYLKKGDKPELPKYLYEELADYILGRKILNCVEQQGHCSFTAEL